MRNVNGEAVNGEGVGVNGEGVNEVNEELRGVYRCRLDSTELCCVCAFTPFFFFFFYISRVLQNRNKQYCSSTVMILYCNSIVIVLFMRSITTLFIKKY